jgi:hypothetical protein
VPIHAYRCACGKQADVLVRAGAREPRTCDEASAFSCWGDATGTPGALTRMVSAAHVGTAGARDRVREAPSEGAGCDHCNGEPTVCGVDGA